MAGINREAVVMHHSRKAWVLCVHDEGWLHQWLPLGCTFRFALALVLGHLFRLHFFRAHNVLELEVLLVVGIAIIVIVDIIIAGDGALGCVLESAYDRRVFRLFG